MALERGGRDNISAVMVRAEDLYSGDRTLFNPAL
jgi:protein phosphatase